MASFFEQFTPQEVARISAAGRHSTLPEGWSPIWEKTPADKAYILLDGTVSVRKDGQEIAQIGPGEIFGEAAIARHTLRTASIVALTPLEVIHFTDDAIRELIEELPSFEAALDEVAKSRLGVSEDLDLEGALEVIEAYLLGEEPSLTRVQVAEQAGVPLETAMELWHLMGFAHVEDDVVAFTPADVKALQLSTDLMDLGVLGPDRQSALVRTWGRSYARLAEWQTALLADVALERGANPADTLAEVTGEVLPRVEALQSYVWRRHLVSAGSRLLAVETPGSPVSDLAVCFVDIVGYTSRSKALSEVELVEWLEHFESQTLELVVDVGGRIIKNIGDEVLFVTDDPAAAVDIALEMIRRGADDDDKFPAVRAGIAYGEVVSRLGDVFGPVVNIASRLTSAARPDSVLVDRGAYEVLAGRVHDDADDPDESASTAYRFKRLRRLSVKGYARLRAWSVRPVSES